MASNVGTPGGWLPTAALARRRRPARHRPATGSCERAVPDARRTLEEDLRYAEGLGAEVVRVQGADAARELTRVARERNRRAS